MSGRKIPREHENPIDNLLIDISQDVGKALRPYPVFTPNFFTTISLIVALCSVYFIYKKSYRLASILLFVAYFFDCLDGNFARTYNMETDFGDKYDHFSDLFKIIAVLYFVLISKLKFTTKVYFTILYFITLLFSVIQIGCQEVAYGGHYSGSLSVFKYLCFSDNQIMWSRYLGCGTGQAIVCIMLYNLAWFNKNVR